MKSKQSVRWIALVTVLLNGCAAARQYPPPPLLPSMSLLEPGESPAAAWHSDSGNGAFTAVPKNVLVLSGGGVNGAYTAGVLKGWTASGNRPQFDVVTGISTGALIAPYAFLGPEYDAELEQLYTSMRQENVLCPHLLLLDSLASSDPLEKQIAAHATPAILQKIADAHRNGRRLYVGTTNLDTKSLVVWDLGAIASRNSAESRALFQKVLLASCSIPGLFPPVPIDIEIDGKRFTELHVDGSVTACMFLQPAMLGIGPDGALPSGVSLPSIHVIVAGKLHQTAAPTNGRLFSIAGESISTVFQAKTEGELTRLFMFARYAKADFKVAGIPQDYPLSGDCMSFDPQVMRGLFDAGRRGGQDGTVWRTLPPDLETGLFSSPRSDTRFATIGKTTVPPSWIPEQLKITLGTDDAPNRH